MKIYQAVEKLDANDIEKISVIIDNAGNQEEQPQLPLVEEDFAEYQDQVGELPEEDLMTSVSQIKPSAS